MKIDTKYNIGDEVWFKTLGINYKANVTKIVIHVFIDGNVIINYDIARSGYEYERNEDELFLTKEELLKSL